MVWNKQEQRRKYWVTRSSVRSFARTAHSFACSAHSWESEFLMSQNDLALSHSALVEVVATVVLQEDWIDFARLVDWEREEIRSEG